MPAPDDGRDVTAVMGRRILAWLIDLVIYLGLTVALFAVLADYVEIPSGSFLDACERLQFQDSDAAAGCIEVGDRAYVTSNADNGIQTLASFGYFVFFILLQGIAGGSPGKLLTGLRVVNQHGKRAGVGRSIGRTLLWIVDAAPWFLPLVGLITGLTSTGHRRVGDMAAGTYVVARKDVGQPVRTGAAAAPPAQGAWGAPPPQWAPQSPPPGGASAAPPPMPGAAAPTAPPPTAPPAGPASAVTPAAPVPSVGDLSPDVSGVPADQPAPPPLPDNEPPTWTPPTLDDVTPTEPAPPVAPTTPEIDGRVDEAAPEVAPDDQWWSGPEATPEADVLGSEVPEALAAPEMPAWEDPSPTPDTTGDSWSPPTTPAADIDEAENTSPTAGPAPFTAPGADPVTDAPPAPEPAPRPPPQWDQARGTYIQWEPSLQQWLQWDEPAQRWKDIDS